ncbi:MAG: hypothetical protein KDK70_28445, partial [Myxococcales bacterium]|nr:hypothetical protein [Myxococcales bacterium]
FTLREVERLGEEIGLSSDAVRSALVHVRTGALVPVSEARPALADRLMGPVQVVIGRRVAGPAAEVRARIDAFMREQLLAVRRNFGERVLWGPTESIVSQMRRALDLGNRYTLRGAEEIEVAVVPRSEPAGDVEVVLVARFPEARRKQLQGGTIGAGVLLGAGAIGAAVLAPLAVAGAVAAAVGGVGLAGVAVSATRRTYRRQVESVRVALERLLDALEHER